MEVPRAVLWTGAHPTTPWPAAVLRIVVGVLFVGYGCRRSPSTTAG
ncbi:hypothetical protein [Pseudonocardia sp. NPDC046786]